MSASTSPPSNRRLPLIAAALGSGLAVLVSASAVAQGLPRFPYPPERGQTDRNRQPPRPAPAPELSPEERAARRAAANSLDGLHERLKAVGSAQEAQPIVRQILRRWQRSGSATADLLMSRAREALGNNNPPLAIELADRLLVIQPEWAEAWQLRGVAFFNLLDDDRAIADFREVLRREPRHFIALGAAAAALRRQGDTKAAMRAFRAAYEIHPFLPGVKEAIDSLRLEVDGRDT